MLIFGFIFLKEKIYRDYHNKVYAYAISHVRSREDAEDIVSEVFLKVYEKPDTYDESKASMSTWIYQMTKNKVIDYRTSGRKGMGNQ